MKSGPDPDSVSMCQQGWGWGRGQVRYVVTDSAVANPTEAERSTIQDATVRKDIKMLQPGVVNHISRSLRTMSTRERI